MTLPDGMKSAADASSLVVTLGALFDALPKIAAGFAVLWYIYRFYSAWRGRVVKE